MFTPTCSQNPMLRLYLLQPLLFILFALSSTSEPNNDAIVQYCSHRNLTCGDQTYNISYPFQLSTDGDYFCGDLGFNLSCSRNNRTFLLTDLSQKEYRVDSINYKKYEMKITNLNFTGDLEGDLNFTNNRSSCPQKYFTNSTFDQLLFGSTDDANLTFYWNCSSAVGHEVQLQNISCKSSAGRKSYYSLPDHSLSADMRGECSSIVVVPINRTALKIKKSGGGIDIGSVLKQGFGLNWKVRSWWCDKCMASGGICGFNQNCYCLNATGINGTCSFSNGTCSLNATSINWTCSRNSTAEKKSNTGKYIGIGIGGGFGGVCILGCVFLILFKRRKKLQQPALEGSNHRTHIFSYDELEEATNGFNASRALGDGAFGTVYKGKLRDGRTVAVKRLYENNYRRLEQFKNEVDILSNLRHQNLVTLYGCTSRHSRELLLVYEYIPKGTVADHLHGPLASKESLPWSVRMSIAIETADALAYLHAVEPQIIHRDVKTNNILLSTNYHVKVADFGLSRLFPLDATHVSTAPQGTPGYVDPEYHQCYQLTDKSDVYSFGVVLVELISSKPAVDISRHRHEINLANLALTKIQNRQVDDLVDPELGYEDDSEIRRMINQVAEVAFRCLQLDREMRPSIKEVVVALRGIQDAGYNEEKEGDVSEAQTKEECRLLKSIVPCSPDTVADRWESRSTTPNTST